MRSLRGFLIIYFGIAGVMILAGFVLGSFMLPGTDLQPCWANAASVGEYNLACMVQKAPEWFLKVGVWLVASWLANWLVLVVMNYRSGHELVEQMTTADNNDSPGWLSAGLYIAIAYMVGRVPYVGMAEFVVNCLIRIGVTSAFAMLVAIMLIWRRTNVRNLDNFSKQIQQQGTDGVAIWWLVAWIAAAFLAG